MAIGEDAPADADFLIAQSIKDGAKRNYSWRWNVVMTVLFGGIGWLLAFEVRITDNPTAGCECLIAIKGVPLPVGWLGGLLKPIVLIIGWLALAVAAITLTSLVGAAFGADWDWAKKAAGDCPACLRPALREGTVSHTQTVGSVQIERSGIVNICANPECAYAAAWGVGGKGSPISVKVTPIRS
jgi:hypothetical protein